MDAPVVEAAAHVAVLLGGHVHPVAEKHDRNPEGAEADPRHERGVQAHALDLDRDTVYAPRLVGSVHAEGKAG